MNTPKTQLRHQLRAVRRALSSEQQAHAAQAAAEQAQKLPGFGEAQHIGLYMAADGELDPEYLLQACAQAGKACYLPVVGDNNSMAFALYEPGSRLQANQYGILEPLDCAPRINTEKLDWVFMPLVGFSRDGRRLGMGGGYYDRAFEFLVAETGAKTRSAANAKPLLVGLAHSAQEICSSDAPAAEHWDIPMHYVVSETEIVST